MPAVLVEVGFLDNEADNQRFDECFEHTAQAIAGRDPDDAAKSGRAAGVLSDPGEVHMQRKIWPRDCSARLQAAGYPAFLVYQDGLYKVRVGAYLNLDNAAWMEKTLRTAGYPTLFGAGAGSVLMVLDSVIADAKKIR